MPQILSKKYIIQKKIGSGSYGKVYSAKNIFNNEIVVIKVEKVCNKVNSKDTSSLIQESIIYTKLNKIHFTNTHYHYFKCGIPKIYDFYMDRKLLVKKKYYCYNQYLIMQYVGHDLSRTFDKFNGLIPILNIYCMAVQMINLIEQLHNIGWLHRDIKPENFTLYKRVIYMIDFGLARKWEDLVDRYDSLFVRGQSSSSIAGTARYMSINVHNGKSYSWRDDLESLGYVLIYFYRGSLPWQGINEKNNRKLMNKIYSIKLQKKRLCKKLPSALYDYMQYCYKLKIDSVPNYNYLKSLFIKKIDTYIKSTEKS